MRKLVEWTFVSLEGVIDSPVWAQPYMDDEHHRYAVALLRAARSDAVRERHRRAQVRAGCEKIAPSTRGPTPVFVTKLVTKMIQIRHLRGLIKPGVRHRLSDAGSWSRPELPQEPAHRRESRAPRTRDEQAWLLELGSRGTARAKRRRSAVA